MAPTITELHIHTDESGRINVPPEYRSNATYGPAVKALEVELYSEGVISNDRIAAFLNAAGHGQLGLSERIVYRFCNPAKGNEPGTERVDCPGNGGISSEQDCRF
ncbi:hypothetical protein [Clostridium sp. 1001271st1 H5]|mgnify:FL=1|uniref:hypothetical protein n=1 Tax=Clostridium sp. 1001271st1 H5 TaxID=2559708 RepID=UPI0015B3DDF8|nr:hypothetical protein [Clostridium sp. 1001271st1 H5]